LIIQIIIIHIVHLAKILSALLHGLLDRNAAVRKNNAVSIGHIVGSAKDSSLEKLFNTLNTWYLEREGTFTLSNNNIFIYALYMFHNFFYEI